MKSFNKVMLHGNLTSNPEVKTAKNGNSFTTFSIATNRNWKDKDGKAVAATEFHRAIAFGKLGEIVGGYLKKGSPVLISGRLSSRSYVSKEGDKRYITEIVLEDFNFLESRKRSEERLGDREEDREEELEAVAA